MINYQQVPLTHRQTISKSHQLVMQRQVPTTILRTDTDEHLSILREMLRSINSKKRPFNGTGPIFNNYVSSVGRREVERYMLEAIDSDLQTFVLDTGCVSLETLKRLDAEKAMRDNFSGIYLHVIWDTTLSNVYWLYVGASHHVASRIHHHMVASTAQNLFTTKYGRCLTVTTVGSCWLAAGTWVLMQLMNHRYLVC
jgi:hypothetical protein